MASTANSSATSYMLLDSSSTTNLSFPSNPQNPNILNSSSFSPSFELGLTNPNGPSKGLVVDLASNNFYGPIPSSSGSNWMKTNAHSYYQTNYQANLLSPFDGRSWRPVAAEDNHHKPSPPPFNAESVSAIASDPKFRVAVAAAISSLINKENNNNHTTAHHRPTMIEHSSFGPDKDGESGGGDNGCGNKKWVVESLSTNGN